MTENERQQVIQALEMWGTSDFGAADWANCQRALAIMRREREPVGVVRPDGNTFRLSAPLPAGTPIYKD